MRLRSIDVALRGSFRALVLLSAVGIGGCRSDQEATAGAARSERSVSLLGSPSGPRPSASAVRVSAQPRASTAGAPPPSIVSAGSSAAPPTGSASSGVLADCAPPGRAVLDAWAVTQALAQRAPADPPRLHAAAETVRLRLRELIGQPCIRAATDPALGATVLALARTAKDSPLDGLRITQAKSHPGLWLASAGDGYSTWLALYREEPDTLRTLMTIADQGRAMEQMLLLLDAAVFQPEGASEPMLAVASSHPWTSSCWRDLRFRVLAPGPEPAKPVTLFSKSDGGRVCEGAAVKVVGATVRFEYLGWCRRFRGEVMRPMAFEVDYSAGRLSPHFAFVSNPKYVVEDWVEEPWRHASAATLPTAASRLEPVHQLLHQRKAADSSIYSLEQFPSAGGGKRVAAYCVQVDDRPCEEWPRPVDFELRLESGNWLVTDVRER